MGNKRVRELVPDIIIYIFLILMVILVLIPLGWVLSTSIKSEVEIFAKPPRWIPSSPTLSSYRDVIMESGIPMAFLNSIIIGFMTVILSLCLGGCAGYAFARFKFRGKKVLSLYFLMSQMLPLTVLMIPLFYMINDWGMIDTKIGLSIAHLVITMPMVTWMTKGYFEGIPKELEESSSVDGCNTLQTLFHILLPLLRPALATTGIYAFVSSWNEFALANVLTRTDASRTVPISLSEFASYFKVDWGDTMAAAAIITLPIIILFMLVQKHFVEGLTAGAVKG
jgi:ABC-type glycerol-3-phosphate transport system permease component